ncbi:adenine nucleotide translocase lysine N-methyltransferase-like isoform X3 [Bufo gargarizans]|uniref:adenine nucleotide translocase lysine N-methyltransferase-like isoform X3 n=1 Tax=Bufo gargarizans TaxID=30331 RepID=UPI001CF156B0|nr:adenine nucleotide translocase lysine N-methyltransferase-like isoform X3 [Bufo gargarizans]
MEDSIDTILLHKSTKFLFNEESHSQAPWAIAGGTATMYALWSLFVLPGFRQVPWKLKVFAAASMGLHSTGYELNSFLINWAKVKAYQRGISQEQATFLKQDFWKANLSKYNHVTVFLAPSVVETVKKKLAEELPDNARVIVCRFPLTGWSPTCTEGSGLDQVWAYDMADVRKDSDPPLS